MSQTKYIQVTTTAASHETAMRIATILVEQRLSACVQIEGPLISVYRWQGQVEQAEEWRCTAKTRETLFEEVAQSILAMHPYECPEIITTPIVGGNESYLDWLDEQLRN